MGEDQRRTNITVYVGSAEAKRQISAEGMKRIVAATKKRWKRQKAEAVAKKAAPAKKRAVSRKAMVKTGATKKASQSAGGAGIEPAG
jgi:hypothetical protein